MALNFPDYPSDGDIVTRGGKLSTYDATKNTWTPGNAANVGWINISSTTEVQAGQKYLVDTSSSAITLTLPSSPTQGDEIVFIDAAGNAENNNITINRNGNNIESVAANTVIDAAFETISLAYYDTNVGWVITATNQVTTTDTGGGGGSGGGGTTSPSDEATIIAYAIALG